MRSLVAQGQSLDTCSTCGGVWFDGDELGAVVSNLSTGADETFRVWNDRVWNAAQSHADATPRCPRDYTDMQSHIFAGDSDARTWHCASCGGYWFTGQDVKQLIKYVEPNRLEELTALLVREERKELEELVMKIAEKSAPINLYRFSSIHPLFVLVYSLLAAIVQELVLTTRQQ